MASTTHQQYANAHAMTELVCLDASIPAFFPLGSATRLVLPNAIELQDQALYGCTHLAEIVAPKLRHVGSAAFMFCRALDWTVLKTVQTLGSQSCCYAGGGGDVWLPNCVSIGEEAFCGARLGALHAPATHLVGPAAFKGSTVIALHLASINRIPAAFAAECGMLREVACPRVTVICERAFADCILLQHVECPPQRVIPARTFFNCRQLRDFDLSVCSRIEFEAFAGSGIIKAQSIVVAVIGKHAFCKCTNLTSVIMPGCIEIKERAFDRSGVQLFQATSLTKIGHGAFWNCVSGITVDLGVLDTGSFLAIAPYAFASCNIECIVCGRPTTIGSAAFLHARVRLLSIPRLTKIGNATFYGITAIDPIIFPELERIEYGAFYNATLASSLNLATATTVAETAFAYINTPGVYVGKCRQVGAQAFMHAAIDDLVLPACTHAKPDAFVGMSALRISAPLRQLEGTCPLLWLRSGGKSRSVRVPSICVATKIAVCMTLCLRAAGLPPDLVAHILFHTPADRFTACHTALYGTELY